MKTTFSYDIVVVLENEQNLELRVNFINRTIVRAKVSPEKAFLVTFGRNKFPEIIRVIAKTIKLYKQIDGVSMRSSLGHVLTSRIMTELARIVVSDLTNSSMKRRNSKRR